MLQTVPLAIAAGIAGALLQAFMLALGPVVGALPWFVAPLPLVAVGLARGAAAGAVAGLAGAVAFGGLSLSPAAAGLYVIMDALPALVIVTLALRPAPDVAHPDPSRAEHWYPPGYILAWLMLFPPILIAALALVAPGEGGGLFGLVRTTAAEVLDRMVAVGGASVPGLDGETRAAMVDSAAAIVPGAVALSWGIRAMVAGVLAQTLVRRVGQALRPSPAYIALALPAWYGPVFAVALLTAVLASGDVAYVAWSSVVGLSLPFLLLGFKLVHVVAQRMPHPTLLLVAFYIVFLSVSAVGIIAMVLAGLVEYSATLRRRAAGRTSEDE